MLLGNSKFEIISKGEFDKGAIYKRVGGVNKDIIEGFAAQKG